MEQEKVTVSFFLDASRPNAEGRCLIKLNIYQRPLKKRYRTKYHATEREWEKINSSNLRDDELKKIKKGLSNITDKAEDIIKKLVPFSFVAFEEAYFDKEAAKHSNILKYWFDKYIQHLKHSGQIGTAISYNTTLNSINGFRKNLSLHDITPALLQDYETHLLKDGKSVSTVGIYMRQLRAIINQAIDANVISSDKYPFKKYQIPAGRNIKKALSEADLKKLLSYKPDTADKQKAIDFWLFSYLCNGMNFADIIELKPENISGNYLHFIRAKTKRTKKKDLRPIRVGLNARALEIIKRQKNTDRANPFLFPILEDGLTPLTTKHRCQRFIKWVNNKMEVIRKELKIEQKIGTYTARHSFSTVLKRKGIPTEFIKESLGHSSLVTTENYLDSFTDDVKLQYANLLTDLK
ncbi:MAG: site-specific integrase [Verrucomicrobia bacterium]|nr:site-specific integrase [Verrucomicrobiota bacterium]